jgi:hypothetical protein
VSRENPAHRVCYLANLVKKALHKGIIISSRKVCAAYASLEKGVAGDYEFVGSRIETYSSTGVPWGVQHLK